MRTAVSLVLDTRFPTLMGWGRELTVIYNDAYRPLLGTKSDALGKPFLNLWSEAYAVIAPLLERVWAGQASYFENAPFALLRDGHLERAYFDYCLSPLRDETGAVVGLLNTAVENTQHIAAYTSCRKASPASGRWSKPRPRSFGPPMQKAGYWRIPRLGGRLPARLMLTGKAVAGYRPSTRMIGPRPR